MTRRGSSGERRGNTVCALTNSKVAGCSPKCSIQASGGSVFKAPNVYPHRRQSLRLKEINAIYELEDARTVDFSSKLQHQSSGDNSFLGANHIKVENPMPEQGHSTDSGYTDNCGDKESITDCDDLSINDLTLKDLRTRCKSKKRKSLKSVASTATDLRSDPHLGLFPKQNHAFVKPKEEDPDLEEPLISLKVKLLNKSSTERKQRKRIHPSEPFIPVEEITAQTCSLSYAAQCSSPVATDRASTTKELAAEDKLELRSMTESVYENLEVISKKDPLYAGSPELVCQVKKEIMETFLCDGQNTNNVAVSSTSTFIGNCYVLDNSSAEQFQKATEGESNNGELYCFTSKFLHPCVTDQTEMVSHNSSPSPVSELETSLQVDSPELVNVKNEVLETDSSKSDTSIHIAVSSTVDFIAKFSYPENSSTKLHERVDGGESKCGGLTSLMCEPLHCCVNEVSTEHMEIDNFTCLPGSCEEHFGAIRELHSSEMSCHRVSPSFSEHKISPLYSDNSGLLSASMDLSSDVCGSMESNSTSLKDIIHENTINEMNHLATTDSQESMYVNDGTKSSMSEELENLVDEVPVVEMLTCSHNDNEAVNFLSIETHDLGDVSDSRTKGGCLDNLVHEALAGVSLKNSNEDHIISHTEESSSVGAYNLCSPLHSNTCFSTAYDSHADNESSPETEKFSSSTMEQMLNGYTEKVTHSAEVDEEKLVEGLDCHSPQVSPPFLGAVNGLHYVEDSLSKASEKYPSSVAEEKLYSTADMPTYISSEVSNSVDEEGHSIEQELKCDQGVKVEHPPKKLLSNRKDFSPTSQEKLRQVLNGNDLYDTIQISNYGEAEVMMSPERMIKRLKSSRNGFLPLVTKGILKSPDTSCRTPCSCTKSSLLQTQAQKAITFSQRQMHDIESIATKLLKGLKSMKSIVEETLYSEACPSASKFTPEEIRIATESASDLEVTTKKWLSMMAKDCNRFCKIMRSAENKVAAPVNGFPKQQKKITFADEAGGLLCHVKVFEQKPASFVVPRSRG